MKNENNAWMYHQFTKLYQKSWSYATLFLRYDGMMDVIFIFYFGLFFVLLHPSLPKNQDYKKMGKSQGLSSFYIYVPKITNICTVLKIWCMTCRKTDELMDWQMGGWINRQKRWQMEVGAHLKNSKLNYFADDMKSIISSLNYNKKINFDLASQI